MRTQAEKPPPMKVPARVATAFPLPLTTGLDKKTGTETHKRPNLSCRIRPRQAAEDKAARMVRGGRALHMGHVPVGHGDGVLHLIRQGDKIQGRTVIDNIIVAKKRLKEIGAYKKSTSVGGTELGGFGGIGVENWILQNGGSFLLAMETFLDNTVDENGAEISFEKFKKKYPIYDFGQNHRTSQTKGSYDHYIDGLTLKGFESMKTEFKEILKEYGIEYENSSKKHSVQPVVSQKHIEDENKKQFFASTGKSSTGDLENYKISDITTLYRYIAKYVVYSIEKEQKGASR